MEIGATELTTAGYAARGRGRVPRFRHRHRNAIQAWIILAPILVYYILFAVVPVIANIAVSLTHWNGINGDPVWAGVDNYLRYLQGPRLQALLNTALFAVATLVLTTVLGLLIALTLDQKIRLVGLYRSAWYIPSITGAAVTSQLVLLFVSPFGGVINNLITSLGGTPVIWTLDAFWMRVVVILYSVWRGLGPAIVLFLAGLQSIDPELHAAASVDGAGRLARLSFITLPLLKPVTVFVVVTEFIAGFSIFEAVQLISRGGPAGATDVMIYQIYQDAFTNNDLGLAAAGASIMGLILLGATLTVFRTLRSDDV
jgi:multiple sugar transport system permease protein